MKMRYVAVAFTVIIAAMLIINLCSVNEGATAQIDMVALNESMKLAAAELDAGQDVQAVEQAHDCKILLMSQRDYERDVMNAIRQRKVVMDYMANGELRGKIVFDGDNDKLSLLYSGLKQRLVAGYAGILAGGYMLLLLIYFYYIRPFGKLKSFAASIAKGDLDAPLSMQRKNFFGAFTESFDLMREELKRARENEYKANLSKKELVAELSHDMKTPIATIKATCDVLKVQTERGLTENSQKTLEKINIIEQKADMIDQLISNMFHASLEDMETLKVTPEGEPACCIVGMFEELKYFGNIRLKNAPPECLALMDKLRLKQVIDNVVNNSYKYAGTEIDVSFIENDDGFIIEIRDFGAGVSDEELPLISEKYYRGENGKGKSGAGLGLFLAKYFMTNMKGDMECHNDNGFVVNLFLRKAGADTVI